MSDLITLGELTTYETGIWKFHSKSECPLRSCRLKFDTRESAISHYTATHAPHTALCKICEKPQFLLYGPHHMDSHYKRAHPHTPFQPKIKEIRPDCPFCKRNYNGYYSLQKHLLLCSKRTSTSEDTTTTVAVAAADTDTDAATHNANSSPELGHSTASSESSSITKDGDENSELLGSWEDLGTDDSPAEEVSDDRCLELFKRKKMKSTVNVRRLVKQKSRFFNRRHRAHTCTICCANLKNYVIATNHYRSKHGRAISMCPFCKLYFTNSTIFVQHMKNAHSDAWHVVNKLKLLKAQSDAYSDERKFATETDQKSDEGDLLALTNGNDESPKSSEGMQMQPADAQHETNSVEQISEEIAETEETPQTNDAHNSNDALNGDDVIVIGENTKYTPMRWRFPSHTKNCPKVYCNKYFESRQATMQHYCKEHAKTDLLCEECDTLISMTGQHNMINHYQRKHPDSPIPMPNAASAASSLKSRKSTSRPTDIPGYNDRFIELNQKVAHHNGGPSISKPNGPITDMHREQMKRINSRQTKKSVSFRAELAATPKPPALALKSMETLATSKVNAVIEIDLTQNEFDDILGVRPEESGATKTTAVMQKPSDRNIGKTPSKNCAKNIEVRLERLTRKSPPRSLTPPTPPQPPQQEQSACSLLSKRKRTRSTGVRPKACTICGLTMRSFVEACDHYITSHGRNVMICPYCEAYFIQSSLLTKHVLTEHSKGNERIEHRDGQKAMAMDSDTDVDEPSDNTGQDQNYIDNTRSATEDTSTVSKSIKQVKPSMANVEAASSYATGAHHALQIDDGPLNLTINDWDKPLDKPLDLSIKSSKFMI